MNTYYTKCGRKFEKSTKADTTGYQMAQQIEADGTLGRVMDIKCGKCPFVVDVKEGWPARHKRYECRAGSRLPNHKSDWIGILDDKYSIHVHSLDHDFCERIIAFCNANPYLAAGYNQDCADCRRTVSISCAANRAGIAAKKVFIETFFPKTAATPDTTDDPADLISMTEERKNMGKFSIEDILNSAQKVAEQADELEPVPEFMEIRCSLIDFNPDNIFAKHDTAETIAELAADIESNGLLHPVVVNHVGDRYALISGERRFRAITSVLHWKVVQANVYEGLNKFGEMKRLCAANFQVRQYTAAEMLDHYQHLTQMLFAQTSKKSLSAKQKDEIAEMLKVTRRQVSKYARICQDLSAEERRAITENRMSINQADDLAKKRARKARPTPPPSGREPVPEPPKEHSPVPALQTHAQLEPIPDSAPLRETITPVSQPPIMENVDQEPVPNSAWVKKMKPIRQLTDTITVNLSLLKDMLAHEGIPAEATIVNMIKALNGFCGR